MCYQLYYPALYRPGWTMTAAGFTRFFGKSPTPAPDRRSPAAARGAPPSQWGSPISYAPLSPKERRKGREQSAPGKRPGKSAFLGGPAPPLWVKVGFTLGEPFTVFERDCSISGNRAVAIADAPTRRGLAGRHSLL